MKNEARNTQSTFALIIVLVILLVQIPSRAYSETNPKEYVGKWEAKTIIYSNGMQAQMEELGLDSTIFLTLSEDGSFTLESFNREEGHGTWSFKEKNMTIGLIFDPLALDTFHIEDGKLYAKSQGNKVYFYKIENTDSDEPTRNLMGSEILLGRYEQDDNLENGEERIQWKVIGVEDGNLVLISKYIIDYTWISNIERIEELNAEFYEKAFLDMEKDLIVPKQIEDQYYSVYYLSDTEAQKYLNSKEERQAELTPYAKSVSDSKSRWSLRTTIQTSKKPIKTLIYAVDNYGDIYQRDPYTAINIGIRPVIKVKSEVLNREQEIFEAYTAYQREYNLLMDKVKEEKEKERLEQLKKEEESRASELHITEDEAIRSGFLYKILFDEVIIQGYTGDNTEIIIPATIGGYPVTAIGVRAFEKSKISDVKLPSTIAVIEMQAFYNSRLSSITMKEGVKYIDSEAFAKTSLLVVDIPSSVEYICADAFSGCYNSLTFRVESWSEGMRYCIQNQKNYTTR